VAISERRCARCNGRLLRRPRRLGAAAESLVGDGLGVAVACVLAIGGLLVLRRRRTGC
jgi:hypothetical protein